MEGDFSMGRMSPESRVTTGSCSVNPFLEVEEKSKRFACQVLAGSVNNSFPSSPSLLPKSPAKGWEEQNSSSSAHLAGLAHTHAAAQQRLSHSALSRTECWGCLLGPQVIAPCKRREFLGKETTTGSRSADVLHLP